MTHGAVTKRIRPSALEAGDVLLYQGKSLAARLIQRFDGSAYNHASIYDGSKVAEALLSGVVGHSVAESTEGYRFVDVYRFCKDGDCLGHGKYPAPPVIKKIDYYIKQRDRFAYEEIILLALLVASRRLPVIGWIPGLRKILRTILENAEDLLREWQKAGKEPMICSELVYRCYVEAGKQYGIEIDDALRRGPVPSGLNGKARDDARQFAADARKFLNKYAAARKGERRRSPVADFVTPRDLATSRTLKLIGRLDPFSRTG